MSDLYGGRDSDIDPLASATAAAVDEERRLRGSQERVRSSNKLEDQSQTYGMLLSGDLPSSWKTYLNYTATGTEYVMYHDDGTGSPSFYLAADGTAFFGGGVTASKVSTNLIWLWDYVNEQAGGAALLTGDVYASRLVSHDATTVPGSVDLEGSDTRVEFNEGDLLVYGPDADDSLKRVFGVFSYTDLTAGGTITARVLEWDSSDSNVPTDSHGLTGTSDSETTLDANKLTKAAMSTNIPAYDDKYTIKFQIEHDCTDYTDNGPGDTFLTTVKVEYRLYDGSWGAWTQYTQRIVGILVNAAKGYNTKTVEVDLSGNTYTQVQFRLGHESTLELTTGTNSGTMYSKVHVYDLNGGGSWDGLGGGEPDSYSIDWSTQAGATTLTRRNAKFFATADRPHFNMEPLAVLPADNKGAEGDHVYVDGDALYSHDGTGWVKYAHSTISLGELSDVTLTSETAGDYLRVSGAGLVQNTSGLVVHDDFNRASTNTLGNSWTEWESSATDVIIATLSGQEIVQCQASAGANNIGAFRPAAEVGSTDDLIIQMNVLWSNATVNAVLRTRADGTANTEAYQFAVDPTNGWYIYRRKSSSNTTISSSAANKPSVTEVHGIRGVMEGSALRFYSTGVLSTSPDYTGFSDLTADFTLRTSGSDGTPLTTYDLTGFQRGAAAYTNYYDEFIICGRNITVSGVPSGFKVQVDSRASTTSVGADVVIDVDTWALPATTLKVLNASDVVVETITPASGIWGGDTYTYSAGAGDWVNVDASQIISDINALGTVDHGSLTGLGDDDHTQYVLADGSRDMTAGMVVGSGTALAGFAPTTAQLDVRVTDNDFNPAVLGFAISADNTKYLTGISGYAVSSHTSGTRSNAAVGVAAHVEQTGVGGTAGSVRGIDSSVGVVSGATITDAEACRLRDTYGSGTVVNDYGLRIDDIDNGTTLNFAIKTGLGDVVFGTDPGGTGLLRVGGNILVPDSSYFGEPSGTNYLLPDDSTGNMYIRSRSTVSVSADNDASGTGVAQLKAGGNFGLTVENDGDVWVGASDPGGTEVFRVAGSGRFEGATPVLTLEATNDAHAVFAGDSNRTSAGASIAELIAKWNGTSVAAIDLQSGSDTTNKDDGRIRFFTAPDSVTGLVRRLEIQNDGVIIVGGADPGGTEQFRVQSSGRFGGALYGDAAIIAKQHPSSGYALRIDYQGTDLFATILGPVNRDLRFELQDNGDSDAFVWRNAAATSLMSLFRTGDLVLGTDPSGSELLRIGGGIQINGALNHDGSTVGFFSTTPAAQAAAYTVTNGSVDRALDVTGDTLAQVAAVLGTLIADLQSYGLLQ